MNLDHCNYFVDFAKKMIKLDNLFRQIHQESITFFENMTSVKIMPYCIPAVAFTNDEICFRNTKIHNLENLKLSKIALGRSTIHTKKINRFLFVIHEFDELVISGTTDFVEFDSLDEYNTTIINSNLIIYRDYEKPGFFSLEIPFLEGYSESNTDKHVAHTVDMNLKRAHDMTFHLPVRGFDGLLDLIENEVNTPTVFFPENIIFCCSEILENDVTKTRIMSISTENMNLNKQLNYEVFNSVKFVKMGNSYSTHFNITFDKLSFTSKISTKINNEWFSGDDVLVEMKKLHIEVVYKSEDIPIYQLTVSFLNGISVSSEKKIDPYFYSLHFNEELSDCIEETTKYYLFQTHYILKIQQLQQNP